MVKYILWGISAVIVVIMLVVIAINNERGEVLEYSRLAMATDSTLETMTASCEAHHGEVLSTEAIYEEFVEDCELVDAPVYNQTYFQEKVIILYFWYGGSSHEPKGFYDYYYSVEGHEVITVLHKRPLFGTTKDAEQYFYYIEIDKEDVGSADILFK